MHEQVSVDRICNYLQSAEIQERPYLDEKLPSGHGTDSTNGTAPLSASSVTGFEDGAHYAALPDGAMQDFSSSPIAQPRSVAEADKASLPLLRLSPAEQDDTAIQIKNCNFFWDDDCKTSALQDVSVKIRKGSLTMIIGPTGNIPRGYLRVF